MLNQAEQIRSSLVVSKFEKTHITETKKVNSLLNTDKYFRMERKDTADPASSLQYMRYTMTR